LRDELAQCLVAQHRGCKRARAELIPGKLGNEARIDPIGLSLETPGLTEGDDLIGVDAHQAHASSFGKSAQQPFMAAGRLESQKLDLLPPAFEPGSDVGVLVGDALGPKRAGDGDIEKVLRHINADEELVHQGLLERK
jgi:hypothetical protein